MRMTSCFDNKFNTKEKEWMVDQVRERLKRDVKFLHLQACITTKLDMKHKVSNLSSKSEANSCNNVKENSFDNNDFIDTSSVSGQSAYLSVANFDELIHSLLETVDEKPDKDVPTLEYKHILLN